MENEKVTPDAKQENTPAEEVKAQSVTPDAKQDQIPYARCKEVVASNKDLKSKLEEFESAAEKQLSGAGRSSGRARQYHRRDAEGARGKKYST